MLEEAILRGNWKIANDSSQGPTFEAPTGRSYIDLSLSSGKVEVKEWSIKDWLTGGHKTICYEVQVRGRVLRDKVLQGKERTIRWNIRKAHWDKHRNELARLVSRMEHEFRRNLIGLEVELRRMINSAARVAIPRIRGGVGKNRWWSKELDDLKRIVVKAKAELRSNRECEKTLGEYRKVRKRYSRLIRESKRASWVSFVEEEMNGNEWGKPYKLAIGKIRPREVLGVIGRSSEEGWETTARSLLDGLVLDDTTEGELEYHRKVRLEVQGIKSGNKRVRIDEAKVRKAVWRCKSGKAPGSDGVGIELIKEGYEKLKDV